MTAPRPRLTPEPPPMLSPRVLAEEQTRAAIERLYTAAEDAVDFPYPSVQRLVGRVSAGRLVFVAANTGQGKTTFLLDCLDRWVEAGVRLDYVGTEQQPDELRTKWACLRMGIPAGVAINGEWEQHAEGDEWQMQLGPALADLEHRYAEQVVFHPEQFIRLPIIERACADAQRRGCQLLILDHVDRIDLGVTDQNTYTATLHLIRRLKELARDCNLVILAASQMNREARKGDKLAVYKPPQLHHMQGGGMKEQEADVVIGLWRPLRDMLPGEDPKEYGKLLAKARDGMVPPSEFTEPNTMGVILLKHRTWGNREGERVKLRVEHGRLHEIPERDRMATTLHGIRTKEPQR